MDNLVASVANCVQDFHLMIGGKDKRLFINILMTLESD